MNHQPSQHPSFKPFNPSTIQPFNHSTLQPFNPSTIQPFNLQPDNLQPWPKATLREQTFKARSEK
ncbi:MAG: hypothetical protein F6J94_16340 [Moorea sp. SIO1F2]|uniref:hypothetical protein n=1 Tax=unclassified Moorena TaxID=2683338 RepID=UPI0013B91BE4|nr:MULTISPECIES: hypothetical protein [unclassified Moorena]NEN95044.1 hypothetical protein [Moorena sp. SIO3I7]NEO04209.1 hypothetical protein [Moorena sp. SIO3I8]NEO65499.1 hypothetical protein [Moorena sp. SIO4G2]NET83427.1 hypothetical protein [Moorena sp. SIO1F2]